MQKLSLGQLKAASEITGQVSVAWFAVGVIAPLFAKQEGVDFLYNFLVGLFLSIFFAIVSVLLVRRIKI